MQKTVLRMMHELDARELSAWERLAELPPTTGHQEAQKEMRIGFDILFFSLLSYLELSRYKISWAEIMMGLSSKWCMQDVQWCF